MCKEGSTLYVQLKTSANLSVSDEAEWRYVKIDACIADTVEALQRAGIHMRSSCCGHGRKEGYIELQDGRLLLVLPRGNTYAEVKDRPNLLDWYLTPTKNPCSACVCCAELADVVTGATQELVNSKLIKSVMFMLVHPEMARCTCGRHFGRELLREGIKNQVFK